MPNYPRPKSSMTPKPAKSSLHPHGFPTFSETIAGLKDGLTKLGINLVGAGAGIVGNLVGSLANLRQSANEGDEDAEAAYLEAIEMLRRSGSSTADTILRDLGEELGETDSNEENRQATQEPETDDFELTRAPAETPESAEGKPALTPERLIHNGKIVCLECGAEFRQLTSTHLAKHGLSPREYKEKYVLPRDLPLTAKAVSAYFGSSR